MRKVLSLLLVSILVFPIGPISAQDETANPNDSLSTIALRWRETIERVKPETKLIVSLVEGEQVEGSLAEVETETFGLWVEPAEGTKLPTRGSRVKRHLRFADVVRVTYDNGQPVLPKALPAQAPAKSFAELRQSVLPGDTVHIQDASGRSQLGLITEITSSTLTIFGSNGQTESILFRQEDVGRVELETTRTASRVVRGTLIGTGVGIGIAALGFAASDDPDAAEAAALGVGMFGLIGAGIGALVGLAARREIVESRLVYERPDAGWEIDVVPILSKDKKGIEVRIGF